jgi:photosynthetic reaction center L subunit
MFLLVGAALVASSVGWLPYGYLQPPRLGASNTGYHTFRSPESRAHYDRRASFFTGAFHGALVSAVNPAPGETVKSPEHEDAFSATSSLA